MNDTQVIENLIAMLDLKNYQLDKLKIEYPTTTEHGDIATNLAMIVFGQLPAEEKDKYSSPAKFAEHLRELMLTEIKNTQSMITDVMVAGPGFINFKFSDQYFIDTVKNFSSELDTVLKKSSPYNQKKVAVEFTDPNPFKELHIGHAYSNTVGESISRILMAGGAEVKQMCYQGDVGLHVAKSIWGMLQMLAQKSEKSVTVQLSKLEQEKDIKELVKVMGQAYAQGASAFQANDQAQNEIKDINLMAYISRQELMVKEHGWQPQIDYATHLQSKLETLWIPSLTAA